MNTDINWEEVEGKIESICNRFSNIPEYREDLAQELRIHAYYKDDRYTSLYNCAISFYRKVASREFSELPYWDLEALGHTYEEKDYERMNFIVLVENLRKELSRTPKNKWEENDLKIMKIIFDYIIIDIDPSYRFEDVKIKDDEMNHYINERISLTWIAKETGIGYKRLVKGIQNIEHIIKELNEKKIISIEK